MRIPKDLMASPQVTPVAKLVYGAIWDHIGENGCCWPGELTIAQETAISERSVVRAIQQLESAGLVRIKRTIGRPNKYSLTNDNLSVVQPVPLTECHQTPDILSKQPLTECQTNETKSNETKELDIPPTPRKRGTMARSLETEALKIYEAYPRHVGKRAAITAIQRSIGRLSRKKLPDAEKWLLGRVTAYAASRNGQDAQYTPHPATWFNQGRYDDDIEAEAPGSREAMDAQLDRIFKEVDDEGF